MKALNKKPFVVPTGSPEIKKEQVKKDQSNLEVKIISMVKDSMEKQIRFLENITPKKPWLNYGNHSLNILALIAMLL
jgi:hypothetical protein